MNIILAVVGGAIAGAAVGLLFAPEKGSDLRGKIKDFLAEKGIRLKKSELNELVDQIAESVGK